MNNEKLVLIIEDEPKIAQILVDFFTMSSFKTKVLDDGLHAVETIKDLNPTAVVLDLMLPNKDGLTICREVRQFSQVPILMLTARVDEIDRLNGLGIGADDYVCKPFSPREVVARVETILRRVQPQQPADVENVSSYKELALDQDKFSCEVAGHAIELTPVEFRLLATLMEKPSKVLSRELLMKHCYQDERIVSNRTIDSHMKNLRTKIADVLPDNNLIQSIYGVGYKLE